MRKKRANRRRNPSRTPSQATPTPTQGMSTTSLLAIGSVAALGLWMLSKSGSSSNSEADRWNATLPTARRGQLDDIPYLHETPADTTMHPPAPPAPPAPESMQPTRPVRHDPVAPRGVEAPDAIVSRVVGEDRAYKGAGIFYLQSLPYIFAETETQPTGEKDSDQAAVIAAVIRRVLSENSVTWDGRYDAPAMEQLRKALLAHGGHPTRAIPYSFEPDVAGNIYAIAVAGDKRAINPFAPEQSVAA